MLHALEVQELFINSHQVQPHASPLHNPEEACLLSAEAC